MAVFYALLAFFGWGIGDIIIAKSSRKVGSLTTLFWLLVFGTVITSLYIPFAPKITDFSMLLLSAFIGFINMIGAVYYLRGFEEGNVSIVGTIANAFGVITAIAAVIIFKESLEILQFIGIAITAIGLVLTSMDFKLLKEKKHRGIIADRTIFYALIAMVCWAIYYTLVRIPIERIGWFWAGYPSYWFFVVLLPFFKMDQTVLTIFREAKTTLTIIIYTTLVTIAYFAFNLGLTYGYTSVVAPIAGSFPVLFVILSRFVFHEPLTTQQKAGIVSTLTGIVLIALFST